MLAPRQDGAHRVEITERVLERERLERALGRAHQPAHRAQSIARRRASLGEVVRDVGREGLDVGGVYVLERIGETQVEPLPPRRRQQRE